MAAVAAISPVPTESPLASAAATPRNSAIARSSNTSTPSTRSVSSSPSRCMSNRARVTMPLLET